MLMIETRAPENARPVASLTLTLEQRLKTRLRAQLDDGREVGIRLPRDTPMPAGTLLETGDGHVVEVKAASESVSRATTQDSLLLKRACYHLGNRHVQLQVADEWVAYQPDHVLDEMLRGLGLSVESCSQPFEPEDGAYFKAQHSHSHSHSHEAEHSHDHLPAQDAIAEHSH